MMTSLLLLLLGFELSVTLDPAFNFFTLPTLVRIRTSIILGFFALIFSMLLIVMINKTSLHVHDRVRIDDTIKVEGIHIRLGGRTPSINRYICHGRHDGMWFGRGRTSVVVWSGHGIIQGVEAGKTSDEICKTFTGCCEMKKAFQFSLQGAQESKALRVVCIWCVYQESGDCLMATIMSKWRSLLGIFSNYDDMDVWMFLNFMSGL